LCNGSSTGTATATASGGTAPYTYAWSNGQNVAGATGLAAGTYTCIVTDANGCTNSTISVNITQPATAITASATKVNVLCNGSSTGTATATASGGTAPYTYAWSNGQNVAGATGLAAGTYTCIVTDANGCTNSTISVTITQPAAINNAVTQSAGILTATQTGATYQWFTCPSSTLISGATSQSYTPSVVGDYKVTVTVAGCPSVTSACVTVAVLGTNSFDLGTFKFYPNPVNDNLNISYSEELTSVKVINMIGQEVLSKSINATTAQIDMSFLPAGTYLVEVRSLDNFKTIKVIKK
jgi:SprB repeat/Secretion system C-terminal sorting domain